MAFLSSITNPAFNFLNTLGLGAPYQEQAQGLLSQLQAQAAGRGPSLAREEYKTALDRALGAQRSIAAGARPGQQAMAQRMAAQGAGDVSAQLGNALMQARLAEQQNARQLLSQYLLGLRQQPSAAQGLLGGIGGYYMAKALGGGGQGGGGAGNVAQLAATGALLSDRRAKVNIRSGRSAADEFLEAVAPKTYRYRNEENGAGRRLGVMAQDLARARLSAHAVVDTPRGKVIDTSKLAGPLAAALGRLGERVKKLEGRRAALAR